MANDATRSTRTSRRRVLGALSLGGIGLVLAASGCSTAPATSPTSAPAAAPTTASAPTAAPAIVSSPVTNAAPAATAAATVSTPSAATSSAPPAADTPVSNLSGTLNILTFVDAIGGTDSRGAAMKQINANFLENNPRLTVKFQVIPFAQLGPKYMAAFAAGNAPDISWVRDDFIERIVGQGGLMDLNQWISKWPASEVSDFYNQVGWKMGVFGDKRYLVYTFGSVSGLHYRKDLLKKANLNVADLNTWDKWSQALQKLCVDKNGKHPSETGFDPKNVAVWGFTEARQKTANDFDSQMEAAMLGLGQPLLTQDARANWTSDAGIKAMTMWTDLVVKYNVEPVDDITRERAASDQLFQQGRSAWTWIASQQHKDFVTKSVWNAKQDLGFRAWPSFDGTRPSPIESGAWTFGMSSKTSVKDIAWGWIDDYLSPEADALMGTVGGVLPSRLTTLKLPVFQGPDYQYFTDYLNAAAQGTFVSSRGRAKITPATELGQCFQDIVVSHLSVADACKASAARYDKAEAAAK
ncbi:MAG: extracellular solute-binding protein [Chloroflexota bacterium]